VDVDIREEVLLQIEVFVIDMVEMILDVVRIAKLHIVIAEQHDQPLGLMKILQHFENRNVGGTDVLIIGMLPEFIPVAYLDIGKIVLVVIIQCMVVDMTVSPEFVGQAVVAPVYIAEKNKLGTVVKRDWKGFFVHLIQSRAGFHNDRFL